MKTIYCDAAPNTVKKQTGPHGKIAKFDNGGYRVGVYNETQKKAIIHVNTKCPDQFAGECYSVLKAVEYAKDAGLQKIKVCNDRISSFDAVSKEKSKKGYIGAKYLYIASQLAKNIDVEFEWVSSKDNKADKYSRNEIQKPGVVFDTNVIVEKTITTNLKTTEVNYSFKVPKDKKYLTNLLLDFILAGAKGKNERRATRNRLHDEIVEYVSLEAPDTSVISRAVAEIFNLRSAGPGQLHDVCISLLETMIDKPVYEFDDGRLGAADWAKQSLK